LRKKHNGKNIVEITADHNFFNHFIIRLIFSLVIITSIHSSCFAQSPYKLDGKRESILFGSAIGLGIIGLTVNDDIVPFTLDEIYALNRSDVNNFDRSATYNWSTTAASTTDFLAAALILSPAALAFSDEVRHDFTPVLTMYFQTLILSEALTLVLK